MLRGVAGPQRPEHAVDIQHVPVGSVAGRPGASTGSRGHTQARGSELGGTKPGAPTIARRLSTHGAGAHVPGPAGQGRDPCACFQP